jgi:hypothetical protein
MSSASINQNYPRRRQRRGLADIAMLPQTVKQVCDRWRMHPADALELIKNFDAQQSGERRRSTDRAIVAVAAAAVAASPPSTTCTSKRPAMMTTYSAGRSGCNPTPPTPPSAPRQAKPQRRNKPSAPTKPPTSRPTSTQSFCGSALPPISERRLSRALQKRAVATSVARSIPAVLVSDDDTIG